MYRYISSADGRDTLTQSRQQLNHSIQERPWMDGVTKVKALAKLDNMFMQVGRPDTWYKSTCFNSTKVLA